jgi:RNA polymerase sigma-70 factor (ECF subfamily)
VELAARDSYGRLVAWLGARWRDLAAVEDALSEAFAAALRTWPEDGVPERPEAWLLAAARRRLIDAHRHQRVRSAATPALSLAAELENAAPPVPFPDERLPLLFVCAHPAIAEEARAPLMLQTVLGLDAARIAAAWLVTPAAMSQRLVRAKTKIRDARIRLQIPEPADFPARLGSILDAIYAAYGVAWDDSPSVPLSASAPDRATPPPDLAREALWLARALARLLPDEPEAAGLLALILHCEARRPARRDSAGRYVPLSEQDPSRWQRELLVEAEQILAAAFTATRPGPYQWLAAIQSAHAQRAFDRPVDWPAIVTLYDAVLAQIPGLGARVGRAAALAETAGPATALAALEECASEAETYQPYHALRAHLLARLDRPAEADLARERAILLARDPAVRDHLRSS